jgi:hypothetical protein
LLNASVSASPQTLTTSSCPVVITFGATINYSGPAVTIEYQWLRSDSSRSAPSSVTFSGLGSHTVTDRWTVGAATVNSQTYTGWDQFEIQSPSYLVSSSYQSDRFTLTCMPPFTATATVSPSQSNLCNQTFTFTAKVTYMGTAPVTVQYSWLRSKGTPDTNQTFVSFSGPGTQKVTMTWTSSIFQGNSINGWQQLQLQTSPPVLSNQANFTQTCPPIQ